MEYIVCSDGRILCTSDIGKGTVGREIKQRLNDDGYRIVTLGNYKHRKSYRVHSIILETFVPKPTDYDDYETDHIDRNRENNDLSNLRWVRQAYNESIIPFEERSKSHKHEKNGRSKLTKDLVLEIRRRHSNGESVYKLAKEYKCGWSTISHVVKNETWKGI